MQRKIVKQNLAIIIVTLLITLFIFSTIQVLRNRSLSLRQTEHASAQAACNTSFFTINNPSGYTFSKSCLLDNTPLYSTDNRFVFFQPSTTLNNAAIVKTVNSEIKDNTNLSWSITLNTAANVYIMPRHIPGLNAPSWITNGYSRQTNDDLSQILQFTKRKNTDGLIGLYDIFTKNNVTGTINLLGAADTQHPAYSMYIVALIPTTGGATGTPRPSVTPTSSAIPSGSGAPANLIAIAQQHTHPPTDCWTVYKDTDGYHLYNLTDYYSVTIGTKVVKQHPGGDDDLTWACGKDMTDVYNKGASSQGVSSHGNKAHLSKSSAMSKLRSLRVPGY